MRIRGIGGEFGELDVDEGSDALRFVGFRIAICETAVMCMAIEI